ncbi:MAG: hypothetical protein U0K71_13520 [Paludibacteraceae bacterium]|nr:hypothetical protein [Paludibacteraceae bacterium]
MVVDQYINSCEERKIVILLSVLFFYFTNVVLGQDQTKTDTVLCRNKNIIIKYPMMSKINFVNYEEGCFKMKNCFLDTAVITIHCGNMVSLPLANSKDKIICSEFILDKEVRSIRGYHMADKRKKYFREDNFLNMVSVSFMKMLKKQG